MSIKLNRLLLVNWYQYFHEIIPFGNVTVITGETGAGKSVIDDALQYVLVHEQRQFNKAGADKSKRNLYGYVRGLLGTKENGEKEYIRPDGTVALIAAEYDTFVSGVFISVFTEGGYPKIDFFIGENKKLEDLDPVFDGPSNPNVSKIRKCNGFNLYDSGRKYDIAMEKLMKIKNFDIYKTMIKKSLAYQSDNTIDDFIKTIIFQQDDVNVQQFLDLLENNKRLQAQVENNKREKELLEPIVKLHEEYHTLQNELQYYYCLSALAKQEDVAYRKNIQEQIIANAEFNINNYTRQQNEYKLQINNLQKNLDELNESIKNSGGEQYQQTLAEQERIIQKIEIIKGKEKELTIIINQLKALLDKINDSTDSFTTNIQEFINKVNNGEHISHIYYNSLGFIEKQQKLEKQLANAKIEYEKNEEQLKELNAQILLFKKGNTVSPKIYKFIEDCKEAAKVQGVTISFMKPLSDCIDIIDEEWRKVLEYTLSGPKNTIIVDIDAYDFVTKFQETYNGKEIRVYDVKTMPNKTPKENSLKDKISSNNTYAEKVLNWLLGDIVISTFDNIRYTSYGVTKTGIIRRNYQQWAIDLPNTITLGKDSYKHMLKFAEKQRDTLIKKQVELKQIINDSQDLINRINNLMGKSDDILSAKYNRILYEQQLKNIKDLLFTLENGNFVQCIEKQKEINQQITNLNGETFTLENQIGQEQQKKNNATTELTRIDNDPLRNIYTDGSFNDALRVRAETEYSNIKGNSTFKIKRIEDTKNKIESNLKTFFVNNIITKMREYNYAFPDHEFGENEDDINQYIKQYNLSQTTYEKKLLASITEVQDQISNALQTNIFSNLMQKINKAQQNKKELNGRLSQHNFGGDVYEITAKVTKNKEYNSIYQAMKLVDNRKYDDEFGTMSLFNDHENEYKAVEKVINTLMNSKDNTTEMDKILDYRNYLDFDIMLQRNGGQKYGLKAKEATESGGQSQTPYYAILASGFEITCREDGLRTIIIDEAFNRMDASRIKEMINFLSETCKFQLIITTPTTSVSSFVGADAVIAVTKGKKQAKATSLNPNEVFYGRKLIN